MIVESLVQLEHVLLVDLDALVMITAYGTQETQVILLVAGFHIPKYVEEEVDQVERFLCDFFVSLEGDLALRFE